jgi:hypothetical protein
MSKVALTVEEEEQYYLDVYSRNSMNLTTFVNCINQHMYMHLKSYILINYKDKLNLEIPWILLDTSA